MSINTHGLKHLDKHFSLWCEAYNTHADIMCAQETHFQINATPNVHIKIFPISIQHELP